MSVPDPSWLLGELSPDAPGLRLFCLPYAGGGASAYHSWRAAAASGIIVVPVQLPGRENRLREPPERDLATLAARAATGLRPWLDRPFALFGHSMGALIAFEVTRALVSAGGVRPAHLFVSARPAPHLPPVTSPIHGLPAAEFVEELRILKGTPEAVLQHPELMALVMPTLRADFALVETYHYVPGAPLDLPITVFAGEDDEVSRPALDAWSRHTTRAFRVQTFPGGHFLLQSARDRLLEEICADLGGAAPR